MCFVSYIGTQFPFPTSVPQKYPSPFEYHSTNDPNALTEIFNKSAIENIALKKEIEQLKIMLEEAKRYDNKFNEPSCHGDEKVAFIKKLTEMLNVDVTSIFDQSVLPIEDYPFKIFNNKKQLIAQLPTEAIAFKFIGYLSGYLECDDNEFTVIKSE